MRTLNILGEIDDKLIKETLEKIFEFEKEDNKIIEDNKKLVNKSEHKKLEDIIININTGGGICSGFNAICDSLKNLKCKKITRGFGWIASCGLWLFLIGDERIAGEGTEFLYHQMSYGLRGDIRHHKDYAEYNTRIDNKMMEYVINRTKITKEMLDKYETRDWWFEYDEAVELGVVTKR